jgi:hypothetical protein
VHTGSAVKEDNVEKAWKQIKKGVMPILEALDDGMLPIFYSNQLPDKVNHSSSV